MTIDYQQRYKLELAHKTLNWGKYIAFIAIVFIVLFYFGDIYVIWTYQDARRIY